MSEPIASLRRSGWRRLVGRLGVDLRPGEGPIAVLLFLSFFLFITYQYATKSVRQSTFLDTLGFARLPYVYLFVAVCSYPLLRLYARYADRVARHHLIAATCSLIALSLGVFWWLYQFPWRWVPFVFYIWISIAYVMTVSQFWSFANHALDPRQAKRLFGFVGAGGLLGGMAGGQVARFATNLVGTRYALLVAAVILFGAVVLIYLIHRLRPSEEPRVGGAAGLAKLEEARGGLEIIRGSRHLQLVGGIMVLTVMVAQVVDLQFNWAMEQTTGSLDQLTARFGNFYTVMNISAFLFQLVFTARIHRALGVGFAMRVLPVTMALGTGGLILAGTLLPALLLTSALVLKIGENGLRYSLDQATRELLFLPVPSRQRLKAKAFIDVFIQRGAKGLAALVLLPVSFGILSALQSGWISFGLIAIWLGVTVVMYREYVRSFRRGLRKRTVDTAVPINVSDVTTLEILVQSLGSPDPRQVLHSLDLLASHGRSNLVHPLLLYHDDPEVRRKTLEILAESGRGDVAPLIERRLGDDDPDVRTEAIRVLAHLKGEDICQMMLPRLKEANAGVRAAAVACLANHGDEAMSGRASRALSDMLSDADPAVRREAAKAIGAIGEPRFQEQLIRLLYDPEAEVVREAIGAVRRRVARDGFNPLYVPSLVALLSRRRLKHEAREALVAFGEPAIPALVHFMNDPDEQIWVRRALPKTIARIEIPAARRAVIESLQEASDSFLRRKLIEALPSLREEEVPQEERGEVEGEIHREAVGFLSGLTDLCSIGFQEKGRLDGPRVVWDSELLEPSLLERLLAEKMEDRLRNVFGMLATIHSPVHVWAAYRSLHSGQGALRTHALEYLDNILSGAVRRDVFSVIGDAPMAEKLELAAKVCGAGLRPKTEVLRKFMVAAAAGDGAVDADASALAAAAVYTVYTDRVADLYSELATVREQAGDALVEETTSWVVRRLEISAA